MSPARLLRVALVLAATLVFAGNAPAATPDAELLRTYQPVTRFHPTERFEPTLVQSFVADADLERLVGGAWVTVDSDPEPGELPGPGTGIWRLNQDSCSPAAPLGGLFCYAAAWNEGSGGSAVYGRVDRLPEAVVLQYWYFYYDNTYSYLLPPNDFIWQAHEGDWEVVNIVLSPGEEPLEVGYSQHCLGQRRAWAETPRSDETHPVVYVAAGSHANYFSAGVHPFDVACIPPQAIAFFQAAGLPLPVDYTGNAEAKAATIHRMEPQQWLEFPGFWGELQYFHGPGVGTVPFGAAPVGPAYHAVWQDPLGTLALWPTG
jgi:hypothetical protein